MPVESNAVARETGVERIPPPSPNIAPLKVNVFESMVGANCQLLPIFPYRHAGAIVPCGSLFRGTPGAQFGHFFHFNTVAEVVVVYGSNKAMLATGQIFALQPFHGVNSFLRAPNDPDAFLVVTITQRQSESHDQREAVIFRCRGCNTELVKHEYDATPEGAAGYDPTPFGGHPADMLQTFSTLVGSMQAAQAYDDPAVRTCPQCGEVGEPFPLGNWGWDRWVSQLATANEARRALDGHVRAFETPAP
jgi:hypothetical protein